MTLKITLACLIAANLALGACAPLIVVGAAATGAGLTASELRTAESGTADSSPSATASAAPEPASAPSGETVAAPVEGVESQALD
jgi:hypothetical protein